METTILLVEDDENLSFMLSENLEVEGYNVLRLKRGEDVLTTLSQTTVDVILMDVELAGKIDGFQVAEAIRRQQPGLPIIFTTGKKHFTDTERGFSLGHIDYLKKPYGSRELISRINNILNKATLPVSKKSSVYTYKGFSFDPIAHTILVDNKETRLTKNEASFLAILCDNVNTVVQKEDIITHLWGKNDDYPRDHSLNNLSHRIRKFFDENDYVELTTISKVGYRLVEKR